MPIRCLQSDALMPCMHLMPLVPLMIPPRLQAPARSNQHSARRTQNFATFSHGAFGGMCGNFDIFGGGFGGHFLEILSYVVIHPRRVIYSTFVPCLPDADWTLRDPMYGGFPSSGRIPHHAARGTQAPLHNHSLDHTVAQLVLFFSGDIFNVAESSTFLATRGALPCR